MQCYLSFNSQLKQRGLQILAALFYSCVFLFSFNANAEQDLHQLSQSKEWMRLLRYERSLFGLSTKKSAIQDNDFFFSKNGKKNPYDELLETIKALNSPVTNYPNINQHPICRFPSRYKWLKKQINLSANEQILSKCVNYQKWRVNGQITSISIYFATGYFGNPASFFGHPLLKFNVGNGETDLTDTAINYGAMTPERENPVVYVLKGLFGGYSASFTRHDFFYHSHNYSETEMRDLWEYRLNLKPEEIDYIVDYTWEVLGKNHPYYFLVDNCAFRMAEFLEDVFDQRLLFRNKLYVIPVDLYTNLMNAKRRDGGPLVTSVTRVPSRYSRLSEMYHSLSDSDQNLVKYFIDKPKDLHESKFNELPDQQKAQIADTLINYYSFRKLKDKNDPSFTELRTDVIKERFKIAQKPTEVPEDKKEEVTPPHLTQNSFNIKFIDVWSDKVNSFQEFVIRPALYDELDPPISHPSNTSLIVFDTRLRYRDEKLYVRGLDIFRVSTLNPPSTDLPGDGGISWKIQLGIKSQSQLCEHCLVGTFAGGAGFARNLIKGIDGYALLKAGVQNNRFNQGTIHLGPEVGTYIEPFSWWKILLSYELETFQNGKEQETDIYKVEQRFGASQDWDFRLEYEQQEDKQIRFNFGWYL